MGKGKINLPPIVFKWLFPPFLKIEEVQVLLFNEGVFRVSCLKKIVRRLC